MGSVLPAAAVKTSREPATVPSVAQSDSVPALSKVKNKRVAVAGRRVPTAPALMRSGGACAAAMRYRPNAKTS